MRIMRTLALVLLGAFVGGGLVLTGERLGASSPSAPSGPSAPARFEIGETLQAGAYPLKFIKDTGTQTCYLAAVSPANVANTPRTYTITALTQAHVMACDIK